VYFFALSSLWLLLFYVVNFLHILLLSIIISHQFCYKSYTEKKNMSGDNIYWRQMTLYNHNLSTHTTVEDWRHEESRTGRKVYIIIAENAKKTFIKKIKKKQITYCTCYSIHTYVLQNNYANYVCMYEVLWVEYRNTLQILNECMNIHKMLLYSDFL